MTMKLALLLIAFASGLLANPCDSNPRVTGTVTMTCQSVPLELSGGSLLQIHILSASTQTVSVWVEIGWRTATDAGRLNKTVRLLRFPFDQSVTFNIPTGAVTEFVQIEENTRLSSAGFVQ